MAIETVEIGAAPVATEAQVTPIDPTADTQPNAAPAAEKPAEKPPEKAPEKVDPLAPKFAALARKDRELRERQKQLAQYEGIEKLAKEKPLEALEKLGLSYDQITDLILSQGEPPKPEDKIAALEKRMAEKEAAEIAAREAAAAEQASQTVQGFKRHLTETITAAGDKYELINALGSHEDVFELIELNHQQTGKLLSIEEAAQLVEDHLTEDTKKRLGLKKFAPAPATTAPASNGNPRRETSGRTLTNQVNESIADGDDLPLDPDERTAALSRKYRVWG